MTNIDIADFEEALRQDRSGTFHQAVQAFLTQSLADLQAQLRRGVSPLEFEQAKKIEAAILKAGDVIRLSSQSH